MNKDKVIALCTQLKKDIQNMGETADYTKVLSPFLAAFKTLENEDNDRPLQVSRSEYIADPDRFDLHYGSSGFQIVTDDEFAKDIGKSEALKTMISVFREEPDRSYELKSCDDVTVLVNHMISNSELSSNFSMHERLKLSFVAEVSKLSSLIAPSGVCSFDANGKQQFDGNALKRSKDFAATLLDQLCPGEGYGDSLKGTNKDDLSTQILSAAISYCATTDKRNPSKFDPLDVSRDNYAKVNGQMCRVRLDDATGEYKVGETKLSIGPRDSVKTPSEAISELKKFTPGPVLAALESVTLGKIKSTTPQLTPNRPSSTSYIPLECFSNMVNSTCNSIYSGVADIFGKGTQNVPSAKEPTPNSPSNSSKSSKGPGFHI